MGEEIDYVAIGKQIRKYRWENGISQEALAVGVSTTHMSHIETGGTKLSLSVFVKIVRALKIPADFLLNGGDMESVPPEIDEIFSTSNGRQSRILLEVVRAAKNALDAERV